jgi:hypothetical protein
VTVAPDVQARAPMSTVPPVEAPSGEDRPGRRRIGVAAVLVVLGLVLRFGTASPLWLDEALSANIAALPLGDMLDALRRDGHPPLYYLILHAWTAVAGDGDVAVRLLSTVFGLAAVPLVWAAGRRIGGRTCALAALVLYATSPFAIRYSTEARMYSLVALLVVGGWLAVKRAEERPTLLRLGVVSLVAGLLLLTHYWSIFLLTVVVGGLVVRAWRARRRGEAFDRPAVLAAAVVAGGVLFLPWLPTFLSQAGSTGTPWGEPMRPATVLFISLSDWGGGPHAESTTLGVCLLLLAALALLGRSVGRSRIELDLRTVPHVRREWILVVATMALAVVVSFPSEAAFASRYTSVVHPLVILLAAAGVLVLPHERLREAVVAGLAVLGLAFGVVNLLADRTQAGEIAGAISADATPDDLVVYCPDQLAPAVDRLLPAELDGVTFPALAAPGLVDWVDYVEDIEAVASDAFAEAVVQRAGGGDIWLVWSEEYRGVEDRCEEVIAALTARRPARTVIRESGEQFEHGWLERFAAP